MLGCWLRRRKAEQTVRPAFNVVHLAGVFHTADAWVRWRLLIGATDKQMAGWLREFPRGGTAWNSGRGSIFGDERPYALIAETVSDPTPGVGPHVDPAYARAPMWCAVDFVAQGVACRLV